MQYEWSQFANKLVDANELKGRNLIDRDGRALEDKLRKWWENASPWVPCIVVRACSANPVIEGKRRWDEQRQPNGNKEGRVKGWKKEDIERVDKRDRQEFERLLSRCVEERAAESARERGRIMRSRCFRLDQQDVRICS